MDYRRRYLRKLANQSHDNQNEENVNNNKNELKNVQEKEEDKSNSKSIYLQKLLVKNNNSPSTSSLNFTRANENSTPYSKNIKETFSTEDNKPKGRKYSFLKKTEEKYATEIIKEESNPPQSKYNYNRFTNVNSKIESELDNNKTNNDSKNTFQYYLRRNKNNQQEEDNNQDKNNDVNNNDQNNMSLKKRFQVSASATNIIINNGKPVYKEEANSNNSNFYRRNKNYTQNDNNDNQSKNDSKEKNDNNQNRYKYYRGTNKRYDNEQNDKKEENDSKGSTAIPINVKSGYNYFSYSKPEETRNYDIKVNRKKSKDFDEKSKMNELGPVPSNKKYTYVRQRHKRGDSLEKDLNHKKEKIKENVEECVIEFSIIPDRFKRKYGKFSGKDENEDLTFKDENDLCNYMNKKYTPYKIKELFKIGNEENDRNKQQMNDLRDKLSIKKIKMNFIIYKMNIIN